MRQRLTIRVKLAAALAAPLVALVGLAALQVQAAARDADAARREADLASAALGPGGVVAGLQNERNFETLHLMGVEGAVESPFATREEARRATDAATAQFRELVVRLDPAVRAVYDPALAHLSEGLGAARALVDSVPEPYTLDNAAATDEVFDAYTDLVAAFQQANGMIAAGIEDGTLRTGVELLQAVNRLQELEAVLTRTAVVGSLLDRPDAVADASRLLGAHDLGEERVRSLAVAPYAHAVLSRLDAAPRQAYLDTLSRWTTAPTAVDVDSILRYSDGGASLAAVQRDVATVVGTETDEIVYDAESTQRSYVYVAVLAIVGVALVTFVVGRSISRPLRQLTADAYAMANERLPQAVNEILETPLGEDIRVAELPPVSTRAGGEVAQLADALNTVQESALELAIEQTVLRRNFADSFVNLGRRNQNLLGRQLDLVTDLERNETDPEALENLFAIDHLATRMRRNAESLLVLAGLEPPRQWSAPIPVGDVVRGALGEVEDYRRVAIRDLEEATVLGAAATDLTHILAELLENGLQFSPPSEPVEVYGRRRDDEYVVTVVDRGFGMSEADLARANQRLAAAESFTVAPSRYLGHYVAAHLARRHGVEVVLSASPAGGVSAEVRLPATLVDPERRPESLPRPPADLARSADPGPAPLDAPAQLAAVVSAVEAVTTHEPRHEPHAPEVTDGGPAIEAEPVPAPLPSAGDDSPGAPGTGPGVSVTSPAPEPAADHTVSGLPKRRRGTADLTPSLLAPAQPSTHDPAPQGVLAAADVVVPAAEPAPGADHGMEALGPVGPETGARTPDRVLAELRDLPPPPAPLPVDAADDPLADRPTWAASELRTLSEPAPETAAEAASPMPDPFVDPDATLLPKRKSGRRPLGRGSRPAAPGIGLRDATDPAAPLPTEAVAETAVLPPGPAEHLPSLAAPAPSPVPVDEPAATHAPSPVEVLPAAPDPLPARDGEPDPAPFAGAAGGGRTPSGLSRRVRGAQLPKDEPVLARRRDDDPEPPTTPPRPSGEQVYTTLADFRAGVERGKQKAAMGFEWIYGSPEDEEAE